jgi:hypothetical protein
MLGEHGAELTEGMSSLMSAASLTTMRLSKERRCLKLVAWFSVIMFV